MRVPLAAGIIAGLAVVILVTTVSTAASLTSSNAQQPFTIERVSVASDGNQSNDDSRGPSISAEGRFVAFYSNASSLVLGDTNDTWDVFVHDRQTAETTRVSVDSSGAQGNDGSFSPSISADGGFVAFMSFASNLVPEDTNDRADVFIHDLQSQETMRVSIDSNGNQGNSLSVEPSVSPDGRFVAFRSGASNLVPEDTNGNDVFVHDRQTGDTTRVSVDYSSGAQGNDGSFDPSISADGRFVVTCPR